MNYYRKVFNNEEYNSACYISSGGFEKLEPNHSYGPMGRSGYMIHCVTSGKGTFISNGKTYHLKQGDIFYIEPYKTTYMEADSADPWSFYWIRFIGNIIPTYMKRISLSHKNPLISRTQAPGVYECIKKIVTTSFTPGNHDFFYQSKLFEALNILQIHFPNRNQKLNFPSTNDLFQSATRYITNHYEEHVSVQDIVDYLNIDRSYAYRIFKKYAQKSPQDFITDYQLDKACEMLKDPANSVEYVALSCGFSSYQSFFRFFKKKYLISPSKYQEKY
ncbi:AraC-like DNA-binding protein [Lactobacillus colini]|uniref:AraC-like DNA-binding protein n=1 Tax=Lactobacillus colini TaxID=1819254 RepID=A0ABS4ME90_9LACO|nr:AraC family transcriptional regulator [Lactobacillus colini]MBP2057943.1 AraC-like DNA-binding protein [Lactobacillus colini]